MAVSLDNAVFWSFWKTETPGCAPRCGESEAPLELRGTKLARRDQNPELKVVVTTDLRVKSANKNFKATRSTHPQLKIEAKLHERS